ncbi:hypothetical protein L581_3157 [Serratia fonticola AU-AP2C]|nr:hypothetical protein L581_3157 [Serratia fonticola AU-AP2C]
MSDLSLNYVIVHELIKEAKKDFDHSRIYNLRPNVLNKENQIVVRLINEIASLYGKKGNAAHYGVFKSELTEQGPIPGEFDSYTLSVPVDENNFIALTVSVMKQLYKKAQKEPWSSGGFIVFADYNRDSDRFFLITMIKQKEGMRISENLEPEELLQLDLTKINQAARISFNRFSAYKVAEEIDRTDLSYLSFVSKGANQSASAYFIAALGCDKGIASAKATTKLPAEAKKFFLKHSELKDKATRFRNDIIIYLDTQFQSGNSAKLSDIEIIATKQMTYLDPDDREKLIGDLMSHLNSEEIRIPVEFVVNKASLSKLKNIIYKGAGLSFNFDKSLLGSSPDADVWYNDVEGVLSFTNLPDGTKKTLEAALKEKEAINDNDESE